MRMMTPTVEAFFQSHEHETSEVTYSPTHIYDSDRTSLASLFAARGYTRGVEVGVESGRFAKTLFTHIDGLTLYGVDIWSSDGDYRAHVTSKKYEQIYQSAVSRLSEYNWIPLRQYSVDAASSIPDGSLDFVYLDANHDRAHLTADLNAWTPKLRIGGIMSGHDYVYERHDPASTRAPNDVIDTLRDWTVVKQITPWYVLGRPHANGAVSGERVERARSWFWVHK
jgi:predicted O-methyltransferase YrrM